MRVSDNVARDFFSRVQPNSCNKLSRVADDTDDTREIKLFIAFMLGLSYL
jgi:hypothetical protein